MIQLGHQGLALVFLGLALGDVLDDAADRLGLAALVAHHVAAGAKPQVRPAGLAGEPELGLVAALGPQALLDRGAHRRAILKVHEAVDRIPAAALERARGQAGDRGHPLADPQQVLFDIPFEFAQARSIQRELEALGFKAVIHGRAGHEANIGPCSRRGDRGSRTQVEEYSRLEAKLCHLLGTSLLYEG
ncbi:MAG TPA: hypothetical protein PLV04_00295 [Phenylobacterium sp.]|nr:hypothetical protein [Phenylobacterium sp.]